MSMKTILLVEDEAITAMNESRQLEKEGYRVILSYTGEEAVDIIKSGPGEVDLVLMDIDLGKGMDGTLTALEIQKIRDIPILFLSSHTEKKIVKKTEIISSYGYVVKNSGITVLDASIKMAFRLHESNRQLRLANKNFETVFQGSPEGMSISRVSDGVILDVNRAFARRMEMRRDEIVGHTALELNLWADPGYHTRLRTLLKENNGYINGWESRFCQKDGTTRTILMSASLITYDNEPCIVTSSRDITERKIAEELLREQDERYRFLFENAILGVFQTTPDGHVISVNQSCAAMFGYDSPEEVLDSINNTVSGVYDNPPERKEFIEKIISNTTFRQFETTFRRKDGSLFTGHLYVWPITDASGTVVRIDGFIDDVSDRE